TIRAFLEAPLLANNAAVTTLLTQFDIPWTEMNEILQSKSGQRAVKGTQIEAFKPLAEAIKKQFISGVPFLLVDRIQKSASISPLPASSLRPSADPTTQHLREQAELAARLWLINCAENFARYDMISFPVEYGTGAGEANIVDVFRISPKDATSLIDERRAGEDRRKLAGRALMSFGAFLDRGWRKNDMLWGRLDGAERLITALLPEKLDDEYPNQRSKRTELIKAAQIAIL